MQEPVRMRRTVDLAVLVFAAILVGHLAMLVAVPYLATADGASHLGLAVGLWDMLIGGGGVVEDYTVLDLAPFTNLIPDVPLGLLARTIGAQAAEKLVVAGFVAGFPLAVAYAVRGIDPSRWWLAFAALPFSFPFVLHYGFYPFCYGLMGFIVVAGYVVRHRAGWRVREAAVLLVLLTLTYMAHVLPFGLAVAFIGIVALVDWVVSGLRALPTVFRRWLPALVAATPGLVLTGMLVTVGLGDTQTDAITDGRFAGGGVSPLVELIGVLSLSYGTVIFDLREAIVMAVLAGVLAILTLVALVGRVRQPRIERADATLVFALLVVLAVVVLPSGADFAAGGSHLGQRLSPVPVVMLLMWLAGQDLAIGRPRLDALVRPTVIAVSIAVTIGLVSVRLPTYQATSDRLEGLADLIPCVGPDASVIQVNLGRYDAGPNDRSAHLDAEAGRLSAAADGWDLGNIGAALPFFQLRNLAETDPYRHLTPDGSIEGTPPTDRPARVRGGDPGPGRLPARRRPAVRRARDPHGRIVAGARGAARRGLRPHRDLVGWLLRAVRPPRPGWRPASHPGRLSDLIGQRYSIGSVANTGWRDRPRVHRRVTSSGTHQRRKYSRQPRQ